MSRKTCRIFFAISCGVVIGLVIGRELSILWQWLAPIIGGITAFIAVDLRGIFSAVLKAWETAGNWDWPGKEDRKYIRWFIFAWLSIGMTTGLGLLGLFILLEPKGFDTGSYIPCMLMGVCAGYFLFIVCFSDTEKEIPADISTVERNRRSLLGLKKIVLNSFPLFILFYHIPLGVTWIARRVPFAVSFVRKYAWKWFRFVHSDIRLLCLIDAAIATSIGLLASGRIFVYCICGGVLGIIQYHIVSVRWLKVKLR